MLNILSIRKNLNMSCLFFYDVKTAEFLELKTNKENVNFIVFKHVEIK